MRRTAVALEPFRRGAHVIAETTGEVCAEDIVVVWPAKVQQVPDDENPRLLRRRGHRFNAGKVIMTASALDQMPAHAVPCDANPLLHQSPIILQRETVVL